MRPFFQTPIICLCFLYFCHTALCLDCVFSNKRTDFLKLKIIYKGNNFILHKGNLKVKHEAIKRGYRCVPQGDRQTNTHPGFPWSRQRNGSLKRGFVSPCEAVLCNRVFVCLLGHDEALALCLPNTEILRCHPLVYPTGEIKELPPHYSPHTPSQEARGC